VTGRREPVARAIEVLSWMADHPTAPWSIRRVARDLENAQGLLQKDGSGGYLPSIGLFKLCRSIVGHDMPVILAREHLDALADTCGETVMLGAYDPKRGEMMYVDVRQAHHPVQHVVIPNVWRPIYAGATGLAILAFLPAEERQAIYARGLEPLTERTVADANELEDMLATIREVGYVRTKGHHMVGAVGIAAPVFDSSGAVFGDVCITVPEQRFQEKQTKPLGTAAMQTAAAITDQLRSAGYRRGFG
jgi:IclR family acetate operon transcriptional repressor